MILCLKQYPAYCLDKDSPGVGTPEAGNQYTVNVNDVINDVRIWRIAINSYPYQTPESLGVENYLDAFVATKQAIYCIIYNREPSTYFKGGDARGESIKNAIVRLVDIGRNGSQTPVNTDITTNKIGTFKEDGEYYSQEYSVNSPVETSQYIIKNTNGLPNGSKITNAAIINSQFWNTLTNSNNIQVGSAQGNVRSISTYNTYGFYDSLLTEEKMAEITTI